MIYQRYPDYFRNWISQVLGHDEETDLIYFHVQCKDRWIQENGLTLHIEAAYIYDEDLTIRDPEWINMKLSTEHSYLDLPQALNYLNDFLLNRDWQGT